MKSFLLDQPDKVLANYQLLKDTYQGLNQFSDQGYCFFTDGLPLAKPLLLDQENLLPNFFLVTKDLTALLQESGPLASLIFRFGLPKFKGMLQTREQWQLNFNAIKIAIIEKAKLTCPRGFNDNPDWEVEVMNYIASLNQVLQVISE